MLYPIAKEYIICVQNVPFRIVVICKLKVLFAVANVDVVVVIHYFVPVLSQFARIYFKALWVKRYIIDLEAMTRIKKNLTSSYKHLIKYLLQILEVNK